MKKQSNLFATGSDLEDLKQLTKQVALVAWPSPQDYNEAVQNPEHSFADATLGASAADTDNFGLPRPNTGMFASVYRMHCHDGDWALRCFLHFVPDQVERYAAISEALNKAKLSSTVHFDLQERGMRIRGQWYPVLKMQWCEGETLDQWLESKRYDMEALENFLAQWKTVMASFSQAGIAHGDLQHGNIMVSKGQIKIVDYDGMYVPSLEGKQSNELGHRAYQHPQRSQYHFGTSLDNFSAWLIYLSVKILSLDPTIWDKLNAGDDCLLFRRRDFDQPLHSPVFHLLETHENADIRFSAKLIRSMLQMDPDLVPPLSETPAVSHSLPELLEPTEIKRWYEEDTAEKESVDTEADSESPQIYQGKKRPRSRVKGGATLNWRPPSATQSKPAPAPKVLSPLAQLVRKVTTQQAAPQPPAATAASTSAAQSPNQSPSFFAPPGNSGWSPFDALFLGLILCLTCFIVGLCASSVLLPSPSASAKLVPTDGPLKVDPGDDAAAIYKKLIEYYNLKVNKLEIDLDKVKDEKISYDEKNHKRETIQKQIDSHRRLKASAQEKLGDTYFNEGRYVDAQNKYFDAAEGYQDADNSKTIDYARARGLEGRAYEQMGRYDDAYDSYNKAIQVYSDLRVWAFLDKDLAMFLEGASRCAKLLPEK